ncbi:MAG: ABC-type transport auxiliary lipoprotein family protein [Bacillales bacterium]|nr:ABC-type transport auxiliary lipoprotein family protein [Bacillales bacterium]MDY5780099.1 ABC-type transport auxiliary lipoprotein family protein [Succinivibrionaceae bacterium]
MKPNLLLVLCLVAFTGCSFSSNKVEYYLIDNKKDLSNAEKFSIPLVINKLKMPSYLDSKSMVFKLENNEVIKTSNHRWVDLLSSILDKSMKEYLLFDSSILKAQICKNDCYSLNVAVNDFSNNYKGFVDVSLIYDVSNNSKNICNGRVIKLVSYKNNDYKDMVNSFNIAWQDSLDQMSLEIKDCLQK